VRINAFSVALRTLSLLDDVVQTLGVKMMATLMMAFLLVVLAPVASAADLCPPTHTGKPWSVQCFEGENDHRRIKSAFIHRVRINAYGMAKISIDDSPDMPREVIAVDRYGNVVIPNIRHTGDFDYPSAYRGLGRFSVVNMDGSGKRVEQCGYFQSPQFHILVPAQFDQCEAFAKEDAFACKDCVAYCSDADCHVREFIGGRGFVLGTDGTIKREFAVKTLETYCRRPELVRLKTTNDGTVSIRCDGPGDNPFVM
jgi:hypothetical protein